MMIHAGKPIAVRGPRLPLDVPHDAVHYFFIPVGIIMEGYGDEDRVAFRAGHFVRLNSTRLSNLSAEIRIA
jgi:hypothetical protein